MEVFEVISTNLDSQDGYFCNVLFKSIKDAKNHCKERLKGKNPKNVLEDFEGNLSEYDGKSLEYTTCKNNPAIYYRSHYGNYRCVIFVKTRTVH